MGVGNLQRLQHALDAAVLAPGAVQAIQHHVGFDQAGQHIGQVAPGVHAADPHALPLQRLGALFPRRQRHLALGGQTAHQDGDVKRLEGAGHGRLQNSLDAAQVVNSPSTKPS